MPIMWNVCIPVLPVTLLIAVNSYECKHKHIHSNMSSYIHCNSCMTGTDKLTLMLICLHTSNIYPYKHTHIQKNRHPSMFFYIYTCIFTSRHTCIHFCMSGYTHSYYIHTKHIHASCTSAYIKHVHAYNIHVCMCWYMHICAYIYKHTYTEVFTASVYIYTYLHENMHA